MSYHLDIERRGNYLNATITGTNDAETVLRYMNDIKARCTAEDCFRVLIDERLTGPRLDEMQIFDLLSRGSPEALGFFEALAYVDSQQDFEVVKFAETVAVNRGIPIAVFTSTRDAENWLRHRAADQTGQDIFSESGPGGGPD